MTGLLTGRAPSLVQPGMAVGLAIACDGSSDLVLERDLIRQAILNAEPGIPVESIDYRFEAES